MPRLSVILPFYNAAPTLPAALDSLLQQSFRDFEIILVDDGSQDNWTETTGPLLKDRRIRLILQPNAGVTAAHNAGLAVADSEFIARMDADDTARPDRFEKQLQMFADESSLEVAASCAEFGGCREGQRGFSEFIDWSNSLQTPQEIHDNRFVEATIINPTVVWRRSVIESHGSYRDGDFPEDYELWLRYLDAGVKVRKHPEMLLRWNDPPGRLTRSDERYSFSSFYRCKSFYVAEELKRRNCREVVIWGAGRLTRRRARMIESHGIRIKAWVDIDPRLFGRQFGDASCYSGEDIARFSGDLILPYVGSRGARLTIARHLEKHGFVAGKDFIPCA